MFISEVVSLRTFDPQQLSHLPRQAALTSLPPSSHQASHTEPSFNFLSPLLLPVVRHVGVVTRSRTWSLEAISKSHSLFCPSFFSRFPPSCLRGGGNRERGFFWALCPTQSSSCSDYVAVFHYDSAAHAHCIKPQNSSQDKAVLQFLSYRLGAVASRV